MCKNRWRNLVGGLRVDFLVQISDVHAIQKLLMNYAILSSLQIHSYSDSKRAEVLVSFQLSLLAKKLK